MSPPQTHDDDELNTNPRGVFVLWFFFFFFFFFRASARIFRGKLILKAYHTKTGNSRSVWRAPRGFNWRALELFYGGGGMSKTGNSRSGVGGFVTTWAMMMN